MNNASNHGLAVDSCIRRLGQLHCPGIGTFWSKSKKNQKLPRTIMSLGSEQEKEQERFTRNTAGTVTCALLLTITILLQLYTVYNLLFLSPPLGYIISSERPLFIYSLLSLLLSLLPLSHYHLYLLIDPPYLCVIKGYPFWFNVLGLGTSFVSLVMFKWWWVLGVFWPMLLCSVMAMYTEGTTIYTYFMPYSQSEHRINRACQKL